MFKEKNYEGAKVGLRINPQVGLGQIKDMSTAGDISKFGIAFKENSEEVFASYKRNKFLNGIHIHVGSQGCPLPLGTGSLKYAQVALMKQNSLQK